ncbi:MAG: DUF5309 family protein [Terriglobales bacterium]
MTVPTNTYQVYPQTNVREDLIDAIYNVDPYKTPLFNMAKKAEAKQTYHEWDLDQLAAQNLGNAAIEGDNPTNISLTPTVRVGNYTQISTKTIQISGTSQSVIAAGGSNKMGYQLLKKSKELKRDIEGILTYNNARAGGSSAVARNLAGIPCWLTFNPVSASGAGTNPPAVNGFGNGTSTRTYSGSTAVTEANLRTMLLNVYTNSGESPEYMLVSPANKQIISQFTAGTATRFVRVEKDATLLTKIDVYESDFGELKMVPDIFLAHSHDCFAINPNYIRVAYLRPFQTIPLAKTGDSDQKMLLVEYTLEVGNEKAIGAIFDTTG